MDIFVVFILILSAVRGMKQGFSLTARNFFQWFICLILGILLCHPVKVLLMDGTSLDEQISLRLTGLLSDPVMDSASYPAIPDLCADLLNDGIQSIEGHLVHSLTSVMMTILSFLAIVLGIKVLCFIFSHLFSKKYRSGLTGFLDGALGLLLGFARGIFYLLLVFLVLIPLLTLCFPSLAAPVSEALENSFAANIFYNENILLAVLQRIGA